MLELTSDPDGNHGIISQLASNTDQEDLQLLISNLKSVRDESGVKSIYLFFSISFYLNFLKIEIMIRIEKVFAMIFNQ